MFCTKCFSTKLEAVIVSPERDPALDEGVAFRVVRESREALDLPRVLGTQIDRLEFEFRHGLRTRTAGR